MAKTPKQRRPSEQGWSNVQKWRAVEAAKSVGLNDEQRKMILSGPSFGNRAVHNGKVSSASPRLNEQDYELFMAHLERMAPMTSGGRKLLDFPPGYWEKKAADPDQRLRHRLERIVAVLEAAARSDNQKPMLEPGGAGLRGWIHKMTGGRTDDARQLARHELLHLLNGLTDYARRHNVDLTRDPDPAPF